MTAERCRRCARELVADDEPVDRVAQRAERELVVDVVA